MSTRLAGLRPSKEHGRNTAREMQPDCEPKPRSRKLGWITVLMLGLSALGAAAD